ncbi:MAG TPA: SusD/RagB family nutrient-binding outer membrane lipoprotein [Longimicrobiaceae bacterium]|nr:SusD/RagB family nutrient-binding outer membrane lipoprotein [Longimicrobiaceae bacterium]
MHRSAKLAGVLALSLGVVGCTDFLTGPGLTENPNNPTTASASQLFVGIQANQFVQQEGQLARTSAYYTQQLSGTNNQQADYGSAYTMGESEFNGWFANVYGGGGLLDMRRVQAMAREAGDQKLEGIVKVWEAFTIGMAAAGWGDIPYREALDPNNPTPNLDPQQQVYADVQKVLDEAIALLGGPSTMPANVDLVYGGNAGRWRRAAYTLKARFHMHTAERLGRPAYEAALAAAQQGINEAPTSVADAVHGRAPGNFRTLHDNELTKANIWAQFLGARQDLTANRVLIDMLKGRAGDPRLAGYFDPAGDGQYRGADQFGRTNSQPMSTVDKETRLQFTFRQPLVTWAETQLIMAEAKFRLGDPVGALQNVNNVRTALGMPALAGPITFEQVAEEKYIAMFQNIEVWNDWKRTCYPKLTPGGPNFTSASMIPARWVYGLTERQNNPNIPLPSKAPARNWNDPNPC